ncbi:MAG TPA: glycosyltransferase family 9 protein [Gemmataceae bacterium]|nr:glycosyltransferase family 9 protein [Gemmataceae bacterium]
MPSRQPIPLRDYPARRIALIKPSALGDIVQSLPVLTALRRRYPRAHIAWIVNRGYEPLLRGHPDLDATLPCDRTRSRSGLLEKVFNYGGFLRRLRRERFDLVIDLQGLFRSGLMAAASGARRRMGFSSAREGATWCYTDVVAGADLRTVHAVDRYWLMAEAVGAGDGPKEFRVPVHEAERRRAADLLAAWPRPWLFLAVGARWVTKRWPPEHFAELARRAQAGFGGTAVFLGAGEDVPLSQSSASRLAGATLDLTGRTSLPQLAALLSLADAMVSNDSGPLHLAAALGRPVVAPYTCTTVKLHGPYGAENGAVEAKVWCQGSHLKRCGRLDCMRELTPDHLWRILEGVLREWDSQRRSA